MHRPNMRKLLEKGYLQGQVLDNGVGFDLTKAISLKPSRRGFGLASMRERAELSGAEFDIKPAEGMGTRIRVRWEI